MITCFKCGDTDENRKSTFVPVQPKGTPNRKWICTECLNKSKKEYVATSQLINDMIDRVYRPYFIKMTN